MWGRLSSRPFGEDTRKWREGIHPTHGTAPQRIALNLISNTEYSAMEMSTQNPSPVTPAKAGGQRLRDHIWIPAFAGTTNRMVGISDTLFCVVVLTPKRAL